jgi:hypothetical protein
MPKKLRFVLFFEEKKKGGRKEVFKKIGDFLTDRTGTKTKKRHNFDI